MTILVISNPVSGDGCGSEFVREKVLPLLRNAQLNYQLEETKASGAAGRLAVEFLQKHQTDANPTILVSGGDGTVHEVINGIGFSRLAVDNDKTSHGSRVVCLVICPQGTANALYSTLFPISNDEVSPDYHLRSVHAFLQGTSRPLVLTKTQLLASCGQILETVLGIVVTSTALHAAILESAEHLRASVPGVDRFKVAAARSISTWYHGRVRLYPSKLDGDVRIFDPRLKAFKPFDSTNGTEDDLEGPFEYFLSTVNVDRLESKFEISPLFIEFPPGAGEMDLIIIRPLRAPSIQYESLEIRESFVKTASATLQAVYDHGAHITLSYTQNGAVTYSGDGPTVVEYIRCGGWEWKPIESDAGAHIVCVDGEILTIRKGGKATCEVITDIENVRFTICA